MSVVVYCDGASRSNPGEASIGVSITESQLEIATISKKIGVASNNVAEYLALIEGLKYCVNSKVQTVCFYLDSKLVVEQILGNFKVKSENLKEPINQNNTMPINQNNTALTAGTLLTLGALSAIPIALLLGGKIKTSQYLSGRYADMLSDLYFSYACLWFYHKNKDVKNIDKLLDISLNEHFYNIQESINLISNNYQYIGNIIKFICYPFGIIYKKSNDKLVTDVSNLITNETEIRNLLTSDIFISNNNNDKLNQISRCMKLISENGDKNNIKLLTDEIIKVNSYDKFN